MKNFVFCKYRNEPTKCIKCHKRCPSISNILYGIIFKLPIIKQIYKYISDKNFDKYMKFEEDRFTKYGDCEDEKIKLIFGTLSYDEMVRQYGATLYTMNDLDIIYDKESKKYSASVEAIYQWDDDGGIVKYLQSLLSQFTKYMIDNNLDTTCKIVFYDIFYGNITMDCVADTIEECYAKFKFMVEGYCKMWDEKESEE